jgi:hypothetical protein
MKVGKLWVQSFKRWQRKVWINAGSKCEVRALQEPGQQQGKGSF